MLSNTENSEFNEAIPHIPLVLYFCHTVIKQYQNIFKFLDTIGVDYKSLELKDYELKYID